MFKENDLRNYVERCFKDAFRSENRDYSKNLWSFEYIMIKHHGGVYQLYPILWCRFDRVLRRVEYRLQKNLKKNFGVQYGNTDEMRCLFYNDGYIDFNFTQAMFTTKNGDLSLSVIDKNTNIHENNMKGECMLAYTYEKLLFSYWNLNPKMYKTLPEDDEKRHLPSILQKDWNAFVRLYNNTFDIPIGGNYDIICSSGISRKTKENNL